MLQWVGGGDGGCWGGGGCDVERDKLELNKAKPQTDGAVVEKLVRRTKHSFAATLPQRHRNHGGGARTHTENKNVQFLNRDP